MLIKTLQLPIISLEFFKGTGQERKQNVECWQGKVRIVCHLGRRPDVVRYNRSRLANLRVGTGDGKHDAVVSWL